MYVLPFLHGTQQASTMFSVPSPSCRGWGMFFCFYKAVKFFCGFFFFLPLKVWSYFLCFFWRTWKGDGQFELWYWSKMFWGFGIHMYTIIDIIRIVAYLLFLQIYNWMIFLISPLIFLWFHFLCMFLIPVCFFQMMQQQQNASGLRRLPPRFTPYCLGVCFTTWAEDSKGFPGWIGESDDMIRQLPKVATSMDHHLNK